MPKKKRWGKFRIPAYTLDYTTSSSRTSFTISAAPYPGPSPHYPLCLYMSHIPILSNVIFSNMGILSLSPGIFTEAPRGVSPSLLPHYSLVSSKWPIYLDDVYLQTHHFIFCSMFVYKVDGRKSASCFQGLLEQGCGTRGVSQRGLSRRGWVEAALVGVSEDLDLSVSTISHAL